MKLIDQKFQPYGTLVVLQMFKVTESKGGVVLPDSVGADSRGRIESPRGLVVAVGPMVKNDIRRGDEVLLASGQFTTVIHGGQELLVCTEDRLVGRVNDLDRRDDRLPPDVGDAGPDDGLQESFGNAPNTRRPGE